MKIRTGFVSNSSSSSFVVKRKSTGEVIYSGDVAYDMIGDYNEGDTLEQIVNGLIVGLGFDKNDFSIDLQKSSDDI